MKKIAAFFVLAIALMSAAPRFDNQTITQSTYITSLMSTRAIELGQVSGYAHDVKYGWNLDLDENITEIIAAQGGQFSPISTEQIISVSSSSPNDTLGGTGARSVTVECIRQDYSQEDIVIDLSGTTSSLSAVPCLYVNRAIVNESGSQRQNVGTITITQQVSGLVLRQIPIGSGITQSCQFIVPKGKRVLVEDITFTIIRYAGFLGARVEFTGAIFSPATNTVYRAFLITSDSSLDSGPVKIEHPYTFPREEGEVIWFEALTDRDDTRVTCRANLLIVDTE
tara:strand:- start:12749 stop:13594 length:846 start_codon:yes stop_codon:yes gene_type:complete